MPRPKVHESVFRRIVGGRDDYAPVVLPPRYAVVDDAGQIVEQGNAWEHPTQAASRAATQECVWNDIWKRRVVYFATVLLTAALALPPLLFTPEQGALLSQRSRALSAVIDLAGQVLPGFAQPWVSYYRENPIQLAVGGVVLAFLLLTSGRLQRHIRDGMRVLWDGTLAAPPHEVAPAALAADWVYRLRTHPLYRGVIGTFAHTIFPFVFGIGALAALVLIVAGTANRAIFAIASATGQICRQAGPRTPTTPGVWHVHDFTIDSLCFATGVPIARGGRYRVTLDLSGTDWRDGSYAVDSAAGFSSGRNPFVFVPALPFRRVLTAQWFVPMARIGDTTAEYHPINQASVEFTSRQGGQLFLFVNDAVGPSPFWHTFYDNNTGGPPRIEVRRLAD